MRYDFDKLKQEGKDPRVHGNGFIQIDLPGKMRFHVFPEVPLIKQKVQTPIHDHVFDMMSFVLLGKLIHTHYTVRPMASGGYHIYVPTPRFKQDTELRKIEGTFEVRETGKYNLRQGCEYTFFHQQFHKTENVGLTATLIQKYPVMNAMAARVLCPVDKEPDNAFSRYQVDLDLLWHIVKKVFDEIKVISI